MENETARKRGGQPGNLNALKHGFYSKQFRSGERSDLEEVAKPGLENEIDMLRVATRRLFEMADDCKDPQTLATIVNTLSAATARFGNLLRIQWLLSGGANDIEAELNEALKQLYEEKGMK